MTGAGSAKSPGEKFAADSVPFVSDRTRAALANEYANAGDHKAVAFNINGFNGFVTGQPNEEAAKTAALEQCQKRADNAQSPRKCELYLYAVGSSVVYPHGKPPVPPLPWIKRDSLTEMPFSAKEVPLVRGAGRARLENQYASARKTKSIALGPVLFCRVLDRVFCASASNP